MLPPTVHGFLGSAHLSACVVDSIEYSANSGNCFFIFSVTSPAHQLLPSLLTRNTSQKYFILFEIRYHGRYNATID